MRTGVWLLLLAVAASGTFGCAARPRPRAPSPERIYEGTLVDVAPFETDFIARQKVSGQHGDSRFRFNSVLQKRGDTLTLIGLTPIGTRAFVLEQVGQEVKFTPYLERTLPFPPRNILIDIHRSLFIGVGTGAGAGTCTGTGALADGEHVAHRHGEEITERWEDGELRSRSFRREGGIGAVRLEFVGWRALGVPADEVRLSNEWFGYQLTITTQSYDPLD